MAGIRKIQGKREFFSKWKTVKDTLPDDKKSKRELNKE